MFILPLLVGLFLQWTLLSAAPTPAPTCVEIAGHVYPDSAQADTIAAGAQLLAYFNDPTRLGRLSLPAQGVGSTYEVSRESGTARASLYVLHPDKVVEAESMPLEDALSALAAVSTKCRDAYVEIGAGQWGFRIVSKSFTKSRRHAKDLLPRSPPGHEEEEELNLQLKKRASDDPVTQVSGENNLWQMKLDDVKSIFGKSILPYQGPDNEAMSYLAIDWTFAAQNNFGNSNQIGVATGDNIFRLETTLTGMGTWQEVKDILSDKNFQVIGHNIIYQALRDINLREVAIGRYRWQPDPGQEKYVNIVAVRSAVQSSTQTGSPNDLPVPLDHLFPENPTTDKVDFNLATDKTWENDPSNGNLVDAPPNDSVFGFYVITSPPTIQVSLDKRDNSPWELFNCYDDGVRAHTVQMICTDDSEDSESGCGQIHLGKGAPGTILEMPEGCGPGRYAVAVGMDKAKNQHLPHHLSKRYAHNPTVYDLTFDYDFALVPRDEGEESHVRIDFSNHVGYWDSVVAAAGETKRKTKRSLDGRNHKRWLEEEWRNDAHFGGLSHHELHKRWFGQNIIDWLKNLVKTFTEPSLTHKLNHQFTVTIIDEKVSCASGDANLDAHLLAETSMNIDVETTFGMTIITKLEFPLDLSQSYVYFANKGSIGATFRLDGAASLTYDSGDKQIFSLPFPGATYNVPGIVTIGPSLSADAALEAEVGFAGSFQADFQLASWDVRQTYPNKDLGDEWTPKAQSNVDRSGNKIKTMPTFNYMIKTYGNVKAHIKPKFTFGLTFHPQWQVSNANIQLIADAYTELAVSAEVTKDNFDCPFKYGVNIGADLYAHVDAPSIGGWDLGTQNFPIARVDPIPIVEGPKCPNEQGDDLILPRMIDSGANDTQPFLEDEAEVSTLVKRSEPIFRLGAQDSICPQRAPGGRCDPAAGMESAEILAGELEICHKFESTTGITLNAPNYFSAGDGFRRKYPLFSGHNVQNCEDMAFGEQTYTKAPPRKELNDYGTEHVLEFKLLKRFLDKVEYCRIFNTYWDTAFDVPSTPNGRPDYVNSHLPLDMVTAQFPGKFEGMEGFMDEFSIIYKFVNNQKTLMWEDRTELKARLTMEGLLKTKFEGFIKNLKYALWALQYHAGTINGKSGNDILLAGTYRVADMFNAIETHLKNQDENYPTQNLARDWIRFMGERMDGAKDLAERFVNEWITEADTYIAAERQSRSDPIFPGEDFNKQFDALKELRNEVIGGSKGWTVPVLSWTPVS